MFDFIFEFIIYLIFELVWQTIRRIFVGIVEITGLSNNAKRDSALIISAGLFGLLALLIWYFGKVLFFPDSAVFSIPEILIVIALGIVLGWFFVRRASKTKELDILEKASSRSREDTGEAIEILRQSERLTGDDSYLIGATLTRANYANQDLMAANFQGARLDYITFRDASLRRANLSQTNMTRADLRGADLYHANLEEAKLEGAYMDGVILSRANLHKAFMKDAHLKDAVFAGADLRGADFVNADLRGVKFYDGRKHATFDEHTILPDDTYYEKSKGPQQMQRFTNPEHPDFWQPEWAKELVNSDGVPKGKYPSIVSQGREKER